MGQPLTIAIRPTFESTDVYAILYYHWSGYTQTSLHELKGIIDCLTGKYGDDLGDASKEDVVLTLIRYIEEIGGGICGGGYSEEFARIQKMYPSEEFKKDNISRSSGLIMVSNEETVRTVEMYGISAEIYLAEQEAHTDVWWSFDTFEECKESCDLDLDENEIPVVDLGLSRIFNFEDIDSMVEKIDKLQNFIIKDPEGYFVEITTG